MTGVGYGDLWGDHKGHLGCNTSVRCSVLIPNAFVIRLIMWNRQARSDLEA